MVSNLITEWQISGEGNIHISKCFCLYNINYAMRAPKDVYQRDVSINSRICISTFQTTCILNDFLAVDFTESAPLLYRKGIWDLEVKWLKWDHIVVSCKALSRIPLTSFSVSSSSLPLAKSCPSSFISLCGELLGPNPTNSTTVYQVPTVCQTLGAGHRVMIKIETVPAWRLYKI